MFVYANGQECQENKVDGSWQFEIISESSRTARIVFYSNYVYHETITTPKTVTDSSTGKVYSVTEIGKVGTYCTVFDENLEDGWTIVISEGVKTIGDYAFAIDHGTIYLPSTLTSIYDIFPWYPEDITFYVPLGFSLNLQGYGNIYTNPNVTFYDDNVKTLCIANWDTNGDGKLSYAEAAAVTDLGTVFDHKSSITRFDELRYFTGLTSIGEDAFSHCIGLTSICIPTGVTSIGDYAFSGCAGLTSITIPESVTSIGKYAFYGCKGLSSITIPENVVSIGLDAFQNCTSLASVKIKNSVIGGYMFEGCTGLKSITIPESVTTFYDHAFDGCTGLTSVTIGSGVTSIGEGAFNGCSSLTSITIPESVTSIGYSAFDGCTGLTSVTIGGGVTSIGGYAFHGCSSLPSITIPENVTSIGYCAFEGCTGLTKVEYASIEKMCVINYDSPCLSNPLYYAKHLYINGEEITDLVIPNSVTSISEGAFAFCTELTSVTIPASVTSIGSSVFHCCSGLTSVNIENDVIGDYMFAHCTGLTSIIIPENVTSIQGRAFKGCSNLTSVTIPASVTSIGSSFFEDCSSLTSVTVNWETPLAVNADVFYGLTLSNITLNVPYGTSAAYRAANVWKNFNIVEEDLIAFTDDNVKTLCLANWDTNGDGELSYAEAAAVTDLGEVFRATDITSFNELQYFTGLTSIGNYAFSRCSSLTNVTIPNSVTSIGTSAFYRCSGLTSVTIPSSVTSIGDDAFANCSGLTSVTIPNSVTSIGNYAFYICSGLTSVTIPNSVTSIGNITFCGCSGLTSISVSSGNTKYDSRNNCNAIIETASNTLIAGCKNTTIPNSVTSIGDLAFYHCSGLTSVTIPNSVTSIGFDAFYGCSSLTSVNIPNSVTSIGFSAFGYCFGLTSLSVDQGNSKYDSRNNCNAIIETASNTLIAGYQNTTIPNTVTSIGDYAFSYCNRLTSINIPNSVTNIGHYAFYYCSGLTSVTIPNSVTNIGCYAFDGTPWYNNQPDGLVYAGKVAYRYKGTMPPETSITLLDGTLGIAVLAFRECSNLTSITIPNSVTSIGDEAFSRCSGLTSVNIPNSLTSIGIGAFEYCSSLTSITIPNSVTSIGNDAFRGCSCLTSVTIPNSVTSIGDYAFQYCSSLTSVTIPNSVTSIGDAAFRECSGLTIVTIPNSVTNIGTGAFYDCSNLTNVKVDWETPLSIDDETFSNRSNATLYVPAGSKSAYQNASCWSDFKYIIEFIDGDVNSDGETDVLDVVDIARYVVGTPAESFVPILADINNSGEVNIADAVCLVNEIAGDQDFSRSIHAPNRVTAGEETLALSANGENGLSLALQNMREYTAFQFDLYVPEGTDVSRMLLNAQRKQKHQLLYNKVEEGHWRIAALSTSNRTFLGSDGVLLAITLDALTGEEIAIRNILFFDAAGNSYQFDDLYLSGTTMIHSMDNEPWTMDNSSTVYDLQGRKIVNGKSSNHQLSRGIYIVDGKKVLLK